MTTAGGSSALVELGWVHARQVLPLSLLQPLQSQLSDWLTGAGAPRRWPWQGIDQQAIRLQRRNPRGLGALAAALPQLEQVYVLALHDALGALLCAHSGWSQVVLSPIHNLRAKLPWRLSQSPFTNVPWHQDYGASDPQGDPVCLLTAWIPLSPAGPRQGGLELIPRSHQLGWLPHERGPRGPEVRPEALAQALQQRPDLQPVAIDAQPGDVVLFDQLTLHRSLPNRSRRCRWTLDLRYAEAGCSSGRPGQWARDPLVGEPLGPALLELVRQRAAALGDPGCPVRKRVDLELP
jgi:ectoine hydroxylase-related dioxygenase (phytanoyl-CoA dioxygenase family)